MRPIEAPSGINGTLGEAAEAQTRVADAIEKLLRSIDRPGDFCVHGRLLTAMPRLRVKGAGALSFPVPEAQIRALIGAAEPAPYGKGTETVVDRSVRNCWQIEPARVRLAGAAWPETFAGILETAAVGLGCAPDRVDARLHRLLIYEPGGFFASHRDTEKADGMMATLSVSLPTAGAGGELVVRHRNRERTIDMTTGEPSELTFAAFYADCTHEIRPVTEGHRLSLVFNLCLRPDDDESPREAPDYTAQIDHLAERLTEWRARGGTDKLVWLLDHEYSEAGLSFDGLKNTDAAVARVLTRAAGRVECEVHAAVVHIEQYGGADYTGRGWDWGDGEEEEEWEMGDVVDSREWLDGWARPDGRRPPLGEVELLPGELLPRGALDDAPPVELRVHDASGNVGVSVERAYRRAALVLWPRPKALEIVARGDIAGAVAWTADELDRLPDTGSGRGRERLTRLIDIWPTGPYDEDARARALMLRLLHSTGDQSRAAWRSSRPTGRFPPSSPGFTARRARPAPARSRCCGATRRTSCWRAARHLRRSRVTGPSTPTRGAVASTAGDFGTSARIPPPGSRGSRYARSCAPICTRPSTAVGWTSSTRPNDAADRSPSCARRPARATGGASPSTRRTSPA